MENLGIYAIYDYEGDRFDTPYFAVNDLFAKRRFELMCAEDKSILAKWPEQFSLWKLGEVKLEVPPTKDIKILFEEKVHLMNALNLKKE